MQKCDESDLESTSTEFTRELSADMMRWIRVRDGSNVHSCHQLR
jgi:hypothetical protein